MVKHFHLILVIAFAFSGAFLHAETKAVVDTYKKQEKELSSKQFRQKQWSGEQKSDLTQKTF